MKTAKLVTMLCLVSFMPVFHLPIHCHGLGQEKRAMVKLGRQVEERSSTPHCQGAARRCADCQNSDGESPVRAEADMHPVLSGFSGETDWIHAREGHVGEPYWPDGISGVTLDPGIDLGHAEPWLIDIAYRRSLSLSQWRAVRRAMGVRGPQAAMQLRESRALRSIRVSRDRAAAVFPYLLAPYWSQLQRRFITLGGTDVPPPVHTAMLSLAYNRGAWNPELAALEQPIEDRDWHSAAEIIRAMQQDHVLSGIRRRRRVEGLLISRSLTARIDGDICRPALRAAGR